MTKKQQTLIFLLRILLGWLMFYSGITKVLNPSWTAAGYLTGAKTFVGFYHWLTKPGILPTVNLLNKWGLTLLGVSLILGIFVRLSSILGAVLMILYYFPVLTFPYIAHSFLVDEHIIYATILVLFATFRAGRFWGADGKLANLPFFPKFPKLQNWLG